MSKLFGKEQQKRENKINQEEECGERQGYKCNYYNRMSRQQDLEVLLPFMGNLNQRAMKSMSEPSKSDWWSWT